MTEEEALAKAGEVCTAAAKQTLNDNVPHLTLIIYVGRIIEYLAQLQQHQPTRTDENAPLIEILLRHALHAASEHQRAVEIAGLTHLFNAPSAEA